MINQNSTNHHFTKLEKCYIGTGKKLEVRYSEWTKNRFLSFFTKSIISGLRGNVFEGGFSKT